MLVKGEEGPSSEAAWLRSSFCTLGTCVEVRASGGAVLIRDSKTFDDDPVLLSIPIGDWDAWSDSVVEGSTAGKDMPVHVTKGTSLAQVALRQGPSTLTFSIDEWTAFTSGLDTGEFTLGVLCGGANAR